MRKRLTTTLIMLFLLISILMPSEGTQAGVHFSPANSDDTAPLSQIITSTPDKDGIVVHVVKAGETLWAIAIAYGTTGAEILINSGFNPNATGVFVGQVLTIRTAASVTATLTPTETPIPPTPTNTPIRPTRTPLPSLTPGPTA
ncbi:MAG: LysM peptidoglycan-binding domain-containing protein, partial [Anaerolineaceae bacterium]|nr:LysM peptidoglycan-binding domain-containing protein [Anaerolineaceae bacterium]